MSWVVIFVTIIIIWPVAIFMKKRLPIEEIYTTVLFGSFIQTLVDTYASFKFKAWGFFEVGKADFKSLWIIFCIYPVFSTMIINWYPYQRVWWKKCLYLVSWAVFSTCYEWLAVKAGIIWHINWNLLYSILLYPAIYYLLVLHLRFYRGLKKRQG